MKVKVLVAQSCPCHPTLPEQAADTCVLVSGWSYFSIRTKVTIMAIIYFCEMEKEMATESQVQRSLVGCRPWGRTGSDTTEVT